FCHHTLPVDAPADGGRQTVAGYRFAGRGVCVNTPSEACPLAGAIRCSRGAYAESPAQKVLLEFQGGRILTRLAWLCLVLRSVECNNDSHANFVPHIFMNDGAK